MATVNKYITLSANHVLVQSGVGTASYTVPTKSYIKVTGYVYRAVGIGASAVVRAHLPFPNDDVDITTLSSSSAAVLYSNTTGENYHLSEGMVLEAVITAGTGTLTILFTEWSSSE